MVVGETVDLQIDFAALLATGETISSATWTAFDLGTNAADTSSFVTGAASTAGAVVTQRVHASVAGASYRLSCQITTSTGHIYIERGNISVVA